MVGVEFLRWCTQPAEEKEKVATRQAKAAMNRRTPRRSCASSKNKGVLMVELRFFAGTAKPAGREREGRYATSQSGDESPHSKKGVALLRKNKGVLMVELRFFAGAAKPAGREREGRYATSQSGDESPHSKKGVALLRENKRVLMAGVALLRWCSQPAEEKECIGSPGNGISVRGR